MSFCLKSSHLLRLLALSSRHCKAPGSQRRCSFLSSDSARQARQFVPDKPSWSVTSLFSVQEDKSAQPIISIDEVKHIAELACLSLDVPGGTTTEEVHADLNKILSFVKIIDEANVDNVPEYSAYMMQMQAEQGEVDSRTREDIPDGSEVPGDVLLAMAPESRPPYFIAPAAITRGE